MSLASAASCTAGGGDVSVGGGTGRMVLGDGLHRFINQACGKKTKSSPQPHRKRKTLPEGREHGNHTQRQRGGKREKPCQECPNYLLESGSQTNLEAF